MRYPSLLHRLFCIMAVAIPLSACASSSYGTMGSSPAPAHFTDGVLVNRHGMTLYIFDKDPRGTGTSLCNGACAANWPPLAASAGARPTDGFSPFTRKDGTSQWAYEGKPLYLFSGDQSPGQRNGDGFGHLWHAVKAPAGSTENTGGGSMSGGSGY